MHNRIPSNRHVVHGLDYSPSEKASALGFVSSQDDHELFAIPSSSQQDHRSKPASSFVRRGGRLLILVCSAYLLYRTYTSRYSTIAPASEESIQPCTPYTPYHAITSPYFLKDNWSHGKSDNQWREVQSWSYDGRTRIEQGRERELDTCLTYEYRYNRYYRPLTQIFPSSPRQGRSNAVLYHTSPKAFKAPMSQEMLLFLRSLIVEVQEGIMMDIFILVNKEGTAAERKAWKEGLPAEFRRWVLDYSLAEVGKPYPAKTFASAQSDRHSAVDWFYRSKIGQQYSYVWSLASGSRTSASWPVLFNHLNKTSTGLTPMPDEWELRTSHETTNFLGSDAVEKRFQPPLTVTNLLTGNLTSGQPGTHQAKEEAERCGKFFSPNELAKEHFGLTGVSRAFNEMLQSKYYKKGHSCASEYFLISAAKANYVPLHVAYMPQWTKDDIPGSTGSVNIASLWYSQWQEEVNTCRPGSALMHTNLL